MSAPSLLFCVGATKAGTSWLQEALAAHPQTYFRSIKELHYFNTIDNGRMLAQLNEHKKRRAALKKRIEHAPLSRVPTITGKLADHSDWVKVLKSGVEDREAYLGYLMAYANKKTRVIGDFTPAYSLLSAPRLKNMAQYTEKVRFIYLLRDPVDRLWSHARMMAKRRGNGQIALLPDAEKIMIAACQNREKPITDRGDYANIVPKLRAAIPEEQVLFLFHEDPFSPETLSRVYQFLDLDTDVAAFDYRVHEGTPLTLSPDLRRMAIAYLRPQYEFVVQNFDDIPQAWRETMMEVRA